MYIHVYISTTGHVYTWIKPICMCRYVHVCRYVYNVYMCMYMSHISVALITDFIAALAQGKPVFMWFNCNTGVVRSLTYNRVS